MGRQAVIVLWVLALVAVVVSVDILFLRHDFWMRLLVNVGIVLVFAAFYMRFLKGSSGRPPQAGLPGSAARASGAICENWNHEHVT
jgi:membrane protein implicated in regulation of membrane protease activity